MRLKKYNLWDIQFLWREKGKPKFKQRFFKRDFDFHDKLADHLIIIVKERKNKIFGTYKLLRGSVVKLNNGFYSEKEFDLSNRKKHFSIKNFLELGVSCVDLDYRSGFILKLLWMGLANYIKIYDLNYWWAVLVLMEMMLKKSPYSFLI